MPRILRIHNRLIIGGPTLNVLNLSKYLNPDFETLLVTGIKEDHEKDAGDLAITMGIEPFIIPEMGRALHPSKDYIAYQKIKKIIRDFKPDIVHTHAAKPGAVGRLAAIHSKVPVVVHTYHGHVFHSYFNKIKTTFFLNIERYMARKTDALIAISPQQKKELTINFKIANPDKFHIIPLGFDLKKFQENYHTKRKQFRHEFHLNDDELAIGIIGRLVPVKNHDLFIQAVAYVLKNTSKKIKAFIIGDGESREHIEAKAKSLQVNYVAFGEAVNMRSPLIFTSWRSDVDIVNAGLDIICLTSFNEGTPVSLIEAQAAGNPIVSTRVGGIEDIVIENQTALLAETSDEQEYCNKLLQMVENDELRKKMSTRGANWIYEKFNVQRLAEDFRKLYHKLLLEKRNCD